MHILLATIATDRETERRRDIEYRHALDLARTRPPLDRPNAPVPGGRADPGQPRQCGRRPDPRRVPRRRPRRPASARPWSLTMAVDELPVDPVTDPDAYRRAAPRGSSATTTRPSSAPRPPRGSGHSCGSGRPPARPARARRVVGARVPRPPRRRRARRQRPDPLDPRRGRAGHRRLRPGSLGRPAARPRRRPGIAHRPVRRPAPGQPPAVGDDARRRPRARSGSTASAARRATSSRGACSTGHDRFHLAQAERALAAVRDRAAG